MGNVTLAEELASADELEKLYELYASESEPESEPEDEGELDEEDDGEGVQPEEIPHG